jgi:protein O-GlcNAc transferase
VTAAETMTQAGMAPEAEKRLRSLLGKFPDAADLHYAFGNLCRDLGRVEEAFAAFDRAIELNAVHADAVVNLGNLYGQTGDYASAAKWLERAVELRPADARTLANLGLTHHFMGDSKKGEELLLRAIGLKPGLVSARLMLAGVYIKQKRTDEALVLCREVLRIEPRNRDALAVLERYGKKGG